MKETRFKDTEIGRIPEDWEVKKLRDLCKVNGRIGFRGYTTQDLVSKGQGALTIGGKHISKNQLDLSDPDYISWEKYYESPEIMVHKGDIVLAQRGTLGTSAIISTEIGPATINPSLVLLNKIICNNKYLSYTLQSERVQRVIQQSNGLTSIPMLSQKQIESFDILYPHISEQHRIASALTSIDNLISSLDKLIEKKKNIKQGTMQQLLTGKKRLKGFSEPRVDKKLGEIAIMNSGGTPTSSNSNYYGGTIQFLSIGDMTSYGKYIKSTEKTITESGLNNSSARIFPAGTLMYAMYASLGKCSITTIETAISQAILGFKLSNNIDRDYLYYYFCFIEDKVKSLGQTGTQSNLSRSIVEDFTLSIPSIAEQKDIASVLTSIDDEISSLEAKKAKYEAVKQGMMQQLLTGRIRLIEAPHQAKGYSIPESESDYCFAAEP